MGGCRSRHSLTRDDEVSCGSSVSQMCCVFAQPAHVKCIQHISVFNIYTYVPYTYNAYSTYNTDHRVQLVSRGRQLHDCAIGKNHLVTIDMYLYLSNVTRHFFAYCTIRHVAHETTIQQAIVYMYLCVWPSITKQQTIAHFS